jgi:hypothetical protein
MEPETGDIALLTEALNSAVKAINRISVPSNNATVHHNINAGSWANTVVMILMAILTSVTATLFFSDRSKYAEEKQGQQEQNRSDVTRMEAEIKDLRDNETTLQAYVNQLYRNQKK